ncbi:MAG: ThiF family adenylyltransferase [bacterium]|nr:ThiF family adenylyltransferase [bacterium]
MTHPLITKNKADIPKGARLVDAYESALRELFFITHPDQKKGSENALCEEFCRTASIPDCFIYFPWKHIAVRTVSESYFTQLRTARNRNCISEEEQQHFRDASIGIAGLSVGSSTLHALVLSGGPKRLKIADPDILELTNLNRINATLPDLGKNKCVIAAEHVWELDPFAEIELWEAGITDATLDRFLSTPRVDIFVDAMDDIALKIEARKRCKKLGIPVVMATDIGDGILLDVERYDIDPNYLPFHGNVDTASIDVKHLTPKDFLPLALSMIGVQNCLERVMESVVQLGKTIASIPQLGTSSMIAGAATSVAIRMITTGAPIKSGRYRIALEEILDANFFNEERVRSRAQSHEALGKLIH